MWLYQNEVRIVTSQRFIRGENTPQKEIAAFMLARQFEERLIEGRRVYYRVGDNIVVADLHDKNVLTTSGGELVPIDVIIGKPGSELERVLKDPQGSV